MLTSDYVLDEVITSRFKRVNFDGALKFIEAVISDAKADQICLDFKDGRIELNHEFASTGRMVQYVASCASVSKATDDEVAIAVAEFRNKDGVKK